MKRAKDGCLHGEVNSGSHVPVRMRHSIKSALPVAKPAAQNLLKFFQNAEEDLPGIAAAVEAFGNIETQQTFRENDRKAEVLTQIT